MNLDRELTAMLSAHCEMCTKQKIQKCHWYDFLEQWEWNNSRSGGVCMSVALNAYEIENLKDRPWYFGVVDCIST